MRFYIKYDDFYNIFESLENAENNKRKADYIVQSILGSPTRYRYIKDDIYDWFKSLDIEYSIGCDLKHTLSNSYTSYFIDILDKDKMVMFKLTWL